VLRCCALRCEKAHGIPGCLRSADSRPTAVRDQRVPARCTQNAAHLHTAATLSRHMEGHRGQGGGRRARPREAPGRPRTGAGARLRRAAAGPYGSGAVQRGTLGGLRRDYAMVLSTERRRRLALCSFCERKTEERFVLIVARLVVSRLSLVRFDSLDRTVCPVAYRTIQYGPSDTAHTTG
jgi:hypothetical protein